jgi:hypothetical protein
MEDDEERTPAGESEEPSKETSEEPSEETSDAPSEEGSEASDEAEEEPAEEEPAEEPPPEPTPGLTAPLDHIADDEKHLGQGGVLPRAGPDDDRASDDRGGGD